VCLIADWYADQSKEGHPRQVDSAPAEITFISPANHIASSYEPRDRNVDSRISVLQKEMTKVWEDLRELQMENARVRLQNETLEREMETLKNVNGKLRGETNKLVATNRTTVDSTRHPDASSVAGARGQPNPNGGISMYAEPHDKNIPGRSAQPLNRIFDMDVSKSKGLPPDIRNRVEVHTNDRKCRL
jgi:FtsZ-binding cell division protein ZapB